MVSRNRSAARRTLGQLGVGDRAEEVDALARRPASAARRAEAVEQLAAAGDDEVHASSPSCGQGVDRDVEALEVVGAVERRDERGDDRVGRDPEPLAQPPRRGAGREELGVDAVRHLDQLRRVALDRARAGRGPSRRGRRESTQTRSAARISSGRDGVLVGLEQRRRAARRRRAGSCSGRAAPASRPRAAQPAEQRQLGAEDERVVEVDARRSRRAARALGISGALPIANTGSIRWTIGAAGVRRLARRRRGEDLDVVAARRPARARSERRCCRRRPGRAGRSRSDGRSATRAPAPSALIAGADEALDAGLLDRPPQAVAQARPRGSQPSSSRARVMSGWRTCGSSIGSASKTISERDSVTSITASASSSSVNSSGLPMLTGRWTSDSASATKPRIRSST